MEAVEQKISLGHGGQSKLLSICMTGRDDDYTLDFRYRITTTLNHFARSLKNLGRLEDVEICVTDWGSQIPMARTLELSPEAAQICRFIYVPPEVIRATQDGKEYFHTTRALNVALRRGCGRFLTLMGADLIFLQHSLEAMLNLLDGKVGLPINIDRTLMMVPRLEVPWQFLERQPGLEEWDRYLLLNEYSLSQVPTVAKNVLAGAGGFMMHRDLYHQVQGCDERLTGWGWSDNDLGLRVSQNYPFLWLSSVGIFMFDMGHPPTGRRASEVAKPNPFIYNPMLQVNEASWGLGEYELEEQKAQKIGDLKSGKHGEPHLNTTDESREKPLSQIKSELQSSEVYQRVERICGRFLRMGWEVDENELDALFFLAWHGSRCFPHKYLELGFSRGYGTAVVADACPSVEVYGVDRWEGILQKNTPVNLSRVLYEVGLRGYLRFLNGDIDTAVQRLRESFMGPFRLDLAFVRGNTLSGNELEAMLGLIPCLAAGGALVLTDHSADRFISVWNEMQKRFPNYIYFLSKDRKTGMLFAATLGDEEKNRSIVVVEDIHFDKDWFSLMRKRIRRSLAQQLVHIGFHAIRNPGRYPEYARRIWRRLKNSAW